MSVDLSGCTALTTLEASTFNGCSGLITVSLPDSITTIGNSVFSGCPLTTFNVPASLTTIGNFSFYTPSDAPAGITSITLPAGVTSIGTYFAYYYTALETLVLPAGPTSISNYFVNGCTALKTLVLPAGVTSIGTYFGRYCTALKTVDLPASLTSIGTNFLANTSGSVETLIVRATTPPTVTSLSNLTNLNLVVKVPAAALQAYKDATNGWAAIADDKFVALGTGE